MTNKKYKPGDRKIIKGHASASSATSVECYIGLPTALFHTLCDEWKKTPNGYPFSKYLVSLIEKSIDK